MTPKVPFYVRRPALALMLLGIVTLLFGTACMNMYIVTEVLRDESGNHSAVVTVDMQFNPDVVDAAEIDVAGFAETPEGLNENWTYSGNPNNYSMTYRREFASLADLALLPDEMAYLTGDSGLDVVRGMTVTASSPLTGSVDAESGYFYTYTATIDVPDPATINGDTDATSCGQGSGELSVILGCAFDYDITDNPELKEAIDNAGNPMFYVEVRLPGNIDEVQINGTDGGTFLDEGRVQWQLDGAVAETYMLTARSGEAASADMSEQSLAEALSGDIGIDGLMNFAGVDDESFERASKRAARLTLSLRDKLPADVPEEVMNEILTPFMRASALAGIVDRNAKPVFPVFRTMAPVITRMAINATTDEAALRALGRLVELMINMEMQRIEAAASGR